MSDLTQDRRRIIGRALHPSQRALDADTLAEMARGLAETTDSWEVRTGTSPAERCYEQLLATEVYEVWVIHWPSGGLLDLHDHGGSAGAFCVISGQLDEAHVECGATVVRTIGPGGSVGFSARHVHAVANCSAESATSLHVYSPPLGPMGFYERDARGSLVVVDPIDREQVSG